MEVYNLLSATGAHIDHAHVSTTPTDQDDSLFTAIILERATITQLQEAYRLQSEAPADWDVLISEAAYALKQQTLQWQKQKWLLERQADKAADEHALPDDPPESKHCSHCKDTGYCSQCPACIRAEG